VTGASSLAWNIVSWRLNAGRASIEVRVGVLSNGREVLTLPVEDGWQQKLREDFADYHQQGTEAVFVTIRNKGRLPVTVERIGFFNTFVETSLGGQLDSGTELPQTLEVGCRAISMSYAVHSILTGTERFPVALRVRAHLGNGATIDSEKVPLVLPPPNDYRFEL
jgi:hypothetical protein